MRAAILLSGHLRGTCDDPSGLGVAAVAAQVLECLRLFLHCDIFLHTWSTLDKSEGYLPPHRTCDKGCRMTLARHNRSSWPCVHRLFDNLTAISRSQGQNQLVFSATVEFQKPSAGDGVAWSEMEKLDSFRMNVASMVGALRLMQQHTAAMGVEYAAAVRMRADLGDKFMRLRRDFSSQFLNHYGWNQ